MCMALGSEQGSHNPALVALPSLCLGFLMPGAGPCQGEDLMLLVWFLREKCERARFGTKELCGQTTALESN